MKPQIFLPIVVLALLLVSACAPSAVPSNFPTVQTGQATQVVVPTAEELAKPTMRPSLTPKPTALAPETVVVNWQRSGGIAGYCDDLAIQFNGVVTLGTCQRPEKFSAQLSPENLALVQGWVQKFQSFHDTESDRATADGMTIKLDFVGLGVAQAGEADRQVLSRLASALVANSQAAPAGGGGYPEVVSKAREALAASLSLKVDQIEVLKVEPVDWPDACLGISNPEVMCAMMITPGYRVILRANGSDYEYHTDARSTVILVSLRPALNP